MKISVSHERSLAARPDQVTGLLSDFERIWPTDLTPAPRPLGGGLYDTKLMLWQEIERPGAARAFRVVRPAGMRGEHWFELSAGAGATTLRHTVSAIATGRFAMLWRTVIGRRHDQIVEAMLDNVERLVAAGSA
jgi:hypothetical protein